MASGDGTGRGWQRHLRSASTWRAAGGGAEGVDMARLGELLVDRHADERPVVPARVREVPLPEAVNLLADDPM